MSFASFLFIFSAIFTWRSFFSSSESEARSSDSYSSILNLRANSLCFYPRSLSAFSTVCLAVFLPLLTCELRKDYRWLKFESKCCSNANSSCTALCFPINLTSEASLAGILALSYSSWSPKWKVVIILGSQISDLNLAQVTEKPLVHVCIQTTHSLFISSWQLLNSRQQEQLKIFHFPWVRGGHPPKIVKLAYCLCIF